MCDEIESLHLSSSQSIKALEPYMDSSGHHQVKSTETRDLILELQTGCNNAQQVIECNKLHNFSTQLAKANKKIAKLKNCRKEEGTSLAQSAGLWEMTETFLEDSGPSGLLGGGSVGSTSSPAKGASIPSNSLSQFSTNLPSSYLTLELLLPEFIEDALSQGLQAAVRLVIRIIGTMANKDAGSRKKQDELDGFAKVRKETQAQLNMVESKLDTALLALGQPRIGSKSRRLIVFLSAGQDATALLCSMDSWVPRLSLEAHLTICTCKVIVNSFSTRFDPRKKKHVEKIVKVNPFLKGSLVRAHWLKKEVATQLGKEWDHPPHLWRQYCG
ncbi:hypothetical protein BT96DRAFT_1036709 [Gymnopus androsaceus JB14]|uniref:Uncharacterized protein n=1 Tax=Gymnopus androsaceus JB14 TaxID=1447944 RepID=A0A6A4HFS6_9AGAR|nr:hypothetical protein BT96DRAFT_1036709 [Gymnopus androsaceus JB14]